MADLATKKQRFKEELPFSSQLPFEFSNGFILKDVAGDCDTCGNEVNGDAARGKINTSFYDIVMFDGNALCVTCMTLFSISGRIKPYGDSVRFEYVRDGHWVSTSYQAIGWSSKLKAMVASILK